MYLGFAHFEISLPDMPTEIEELQAREFLKRAEIKTMKKDLRKLREFDALKERDKIVKIKTLEEQRLEQEENMKKKEAERQTTEKEKREKILSENAIQERLVEKDLKEYATEEERQQIFIFESQRLAFEKKVEEIDIKKDPALKLEKNKSLIEKRKLEEKLNSILEAEKKIEIEEKFITEKSQTSIISSEKKGLEERKWDIEKQIQEIEKKRWAIEKEIENIENKISETDKSSALLVTEKNDTTQKILGIDKSLREIYSEIITRVQQQKEGKLKEQKLTKEVLAKSRLKEKEAVQRKQWKPPIKTIPIRENIPVPIKKSVKPNEETQKENFKEKIEKWEKENLINTNNDLVPPKKINR